MKLNAFAAGAVLSAAVLGAALPSFARPVHHRAPLHRGHSVQAGRISRHRAAPTPAAAEVAPPYTVEISTALPRFQTVGAPGKITVTVHNTGPTIPDLTLALKGVDWAWSADCVACDSGSDPDPADGDGVQAWDFGKLAHGATLHVTLGVNPLEDGEHSLQLRCYAQSEDEGDMVRVVAGHIHGADKQLTIVAVSKDSIQV